MQRDPDSHKGDHGKVAVIGGSATIHGAPIFSALAAEASGADLIHLSVPNVHVHVARVSSLNFQVIPFHDHGELTKKDLPVLLELLATMDSAVIGPGLGRDTETLKVIRELIESTPCTLVLDASALQPWTLKSMSGKNAILTPHLGELERMELNIADIGKAALEHSVTIHVKGHIDYIAASDGFVTNIEGGNAGLTVGGTGDALAGLIAGLIAQGMDHADACVTASKTIKRAGEILSEQFGYAYGTKRVIEKISELLPKE